MTSGFAGGHLIYAGADDDQGDRVVQIEHRLGPPRRLIVILALRAHGRDYAAIGLYGQALRV